MQALKDIPLTGILLSLMAFETSIYISRKTRLALLNPLLLSIIMVISALKIFNISLDSYNKGGQIISIFLSPATVILAVPLYKQLKLLLSDLVPILTGILVGCITAITSIYFLSKLFMLNETLITSLIPKSVTTPIGMEISKQIGGIPAITIAAIIFTGIAGAVAGPSICRIFGIRDKVAIGIALGTASHAIGTTKAIELGETEGAMSGLAIGLAGLATVFLAPLFMSIM